MIDLHNATTNQLLGSITDADLEVLVDSPDRATIGLIADGSSGGIFARSCRCLIATHDGALAPGPQAHGPSIVGVKSSANERSKASHPREITSSH